MKLLFFVILFPLLLQFKEVHPQCPAKGCILLTFNGYKSTIPIWENNTTFSPSNLSDSEKIIIQKHLGYIFNQWDVTITTDDSMFYTYDKYHRVRCTITKDTMMASVQTSWWTYTTSEIDGTCHQVNQMGIGDTVSVVVSTADLHTLDLITYCMAHEIGHTLGIDHHCGFDSDGIIIGEYTTEKENGDGPIMGYLYGFDHPTWTSGYNRRHQLQDDREIISRTFRSLTYSELLQQNQIW